MLMWDITLLLWINQLVATSDITFLAALFLAGRFSLVLSALGIIALWFTGSTVKPSQLSGQLTREGSREHVLLILLSLITAFLLARFMAGLSFRPRPLVDMPLYIPTASPTWVNTVDSLRGTPAFPSDITAIWFALTAGLWLYNRRIGLAAGLISLSLSMVQIGLGYHYPTDVITGACLGLLSLVGLFSVRQYLIWLTHPLIQFFEKTPILAYPLGVLVMIDLTRHLTGLISLIAILFGVRI